MSNSRNKLSDDFLNQQPYELQ